jgi:hypothetical protein
MDFAQELKKLNLNTENSVVIGSGILNELGIRKSQDIDLIVDQKAFDRLKKRSQFAKKTLNGNALLVGKNLEIMTHDYIFNKNYSFTDFLRESAVFDNVRYIKLEFLLKIKESWVVDGTARPKDIKDIKLIKSYLSQKNQS